MEEQEHGLQAKAPQVPQGCGEPDITTYKVTGRIAASDRAGTGGLEVQIVDKGVGLDFTLVTVIADPCGNFKATIDAAVITGRGKLHPDLQAKVRIAGATIAKSEVAYNAGENTRLDVTIPAGTEAMPSELDTLDAAIRVHYGGALGALKEDDKHQDITYLANKTGWDARAIVMAAQAAAFSNLSIPPNGTPGIPAAYFYALFRAGFPANENTLFHTDDHTLRAVWEAAINQGVIDASNADEIDTVLERFRATSARRMRNDVPVLGLSTLDELLTVSDVEESKRDAFAKALADHRNDHDAFWEALNGTFDETSINRLKLDGKLAYLTLNNAPLISALRGAVGTQQLTSTASLADHGYYDPTAWLELMGQDVEIPETIPGETDDERRTNYTEYLASHVTLAHPTACVASMARDGHFQLEMPVEVADFLAAQQDSFVIGAQPIQQFVAQEQLQVDPTVLNDLKRIERVYQITTNHTQMSGLLASGMDSAMSVARYDKDSFVEAFGQQVGGPEAAARIHDRAAQIHNVTLHLAISYLTAKNGLVIGSNPLDPDASESAGQIVQPAPQGPVDLDLPHSMHAMAKAAPGYNDIIAYATMDTLFNSMDFCTCDHCRSILSPAAYLVDLLHFIDQPTPPLGTLNPQTVLFTRRPDIQHLPLTCENTNTVLPYIDIVNETLEYFIANASPLSLTTYTGHDTGTAATEDLLASPAYVMNAAYTALAAERFPMPLPFNQPLEQLRRTFAKFNVPLPLAMERLRPNDNLERLSSPYAWRDILMEELRLSREEYEILTDSTANPLWRVYGFPSGTTDATVIAGLSLAKDFCRRMNITYQDLADIVETRFVNPNADLIPKIARLGVNFRTMEQLYTGAITPAAFLAMLPTGALAPNPAEYGGSITAWVVNPTNYARIMRIVSLVDTSTTADPCNFNTVELRFSKPMTSTADTTTRLGAVEYLRILRFIRLWKKLGWTIEQTDDAICSLFTNSLAWMVDADIDTYAELDAGFLRVLPRLGVIVRAMNTLELTPARDLAPLATCWADIDTYGANSMYRRMFLSPTILNQDPVYADDGYGEFLQDATQMVINHAESLRAAFNITSAEFMLIYNALGFTSTTVLNIPNVSAIYRRGYLARALRISVQELLQLISLTGLDPFANPNLTAPATLALADLLRDIRENGLTTSAALYLVWNQDPAGNAAPGTAAVDDMARGLRSDFAKVDSDFAMVQDPSGEIAKARMTLVYGTEATDFYFGLLNDTFVSDAAYSHTASAFGTVLAAAVQTAVGTYGSPARARVAYDDFRKRLTFTGRMTTAHKTALLALTSNAPVLAEIGAPALQTQFITNFTAAVNALYTANSSVVDPFFTRYAELLTPFTTYLASTASPEVRRSNLLASLLGVLITKRKTQVALQRLADAASKTRAFAEGLLNPAVVANGLRAAVTTDPAIKDMLALEKPGLSAQYYNSTTVGTSPQPLRIDANLVYAAGSANTLPANTVSTGAPISGVWTGSLEAPENSYYNIVINAEAASTVLLSIDGAAITLTHTGNEWRNTTAIEFKAGRLYTISVTIANVVNTASIQWISEGNGLAPIPAKSLYPSSTYANARTAYLRFLKASALADAMKLTDGEVARPVMSGASWLNSLAVAGTPASPATFLPPLRELLDFGHSKAVLSPGSDALLTVMRNPAAATATPTSLLYAITGWDSTSLTAMLTRFGRVIADLQYPGVFRRVLDAFAVVRTMGISATALIAGTTNAPTSTIAANLQAALRALYAADDWRDVVQAINDQMRSLQRDALVAYILHKFRTDPLTAHINTADKLFEYFLMDVQMEPCMQTSRVRHAIASVQLFIDRCFMNLEPRCSPLALNAAHWEWKKRYRIWEANRKVFLHPENWMEPELRDDKSPFFKEIESELLQNDVTEESAATALLNYLAKLGDVAKLEPCGLHYVESSSPGGGVDHVVARTAGAHRKYYYRRREYGYWTPWEHIKLDIEDNPVVPVMWKDRLLLFWLRIFQKGDESAAGQRPHGTYVGDDLDHLVMPNDPNMRPCVILCWSEYYNGKWQDVRTSNVERPVQLGTSVSGSTGAFDRANLYLETIAEGDALRVNVGGWGWATFLLYNMHSVPVENVYPTGSGWPTFDRMITASASLLTFGYITNTSMMSTMIPRNVLAPTSTLPYAIVPTRHPMNDPWLAPLFYWDARHVFYVTATKQVVSITAWPGYGPSSSPGTAGRAIPGPVFAPLAPAGPAVSTWVGSPALAPASTAAAVAAMRGYLAQSATIKVGLGSTELATFNGNQIGPGGAISTP